jgi:hypothetical protein
MLSRIQMKLCSFYRQKKGRSEERPFFFSWSRNANIRDRFRLAGRDPGSRLRASGMTNLLEIHPATKAGLGRLWHI